MSRFMTVLVVIFSFTAVLALILILGNLLAKGASSIDWAFFTKSPVPAGQTGGGVANAIVGTVIIVGMAALIGVPFGVVLGCISPNTAGDGWDSSCGSWPTSSTARPPSSSESWPGHSS